MASSCNGVLFTVNWSLCVQSRNGQQLRTTSYCFDYYEAATQHMPRPFIMNMFFFLRETATASADDEYETGQFKVFEYIFNDASFFIGSPSSCNSLRNRGVLLVCTATWKNSVWHFTQLLWQHQRQLRLDQFSCPGHPDSHKEILWTGVRTTSNCWPIFPFVNN